VWFSKSLEVPTLEGKLAVEVALVSTERKNHHHVHVLMPPPSKRAKSSTFADG